MFLMFIYYTTRCFGLSPFAYNKSATHPRTFESKCLTVISLIIGIVFCFVTVSMQVQTVLFWKPDRAKLVLLITASTESCLLVVQNVLIFTIQFRNRKKLVKFINEAFDITLELRKICPNEVILSPQFRKYLRSVIIAKCLQIILLVLANFSYVLDQMNIYEWIYGTVSFTTYLYSMSVSTLYYCGSVLISVRFHEILNAKLISLMTNLSEDLKLKPSTQTQLFCEFSDTIDCIAVLYNRIVSFVELINEHLSVQIVMIKLCSFVFAISTVRFFKKELLFESHIKTFGTDELISENYLVSSKLTKVSYRAGETYDKLVLFRAWIDEKKIGNCVP